eukprot:scaffold1034_cov127-Cylindrotheca_fusiformis.AAC.36
MDCEPVFNQNVQHLNQLSSKFLDSNDYVQPHPNLEQHLSHLNQSYNEITTLCGALNELSLRAQQRQEQISNELVEATEYHKSPLISLGPDILSQVMTFMDEDGLSKCEKASHTLRDRVITQQHYEFLAEVAKQHQIFPQFDLADDPHVRRQQQFMHRWLLMSRQNNSA